MATATTTTNPETLDGLIAAHRLAGGELCSFQAGPLDDGSALARRMQKLADQILDHRPATIE